MPHVVPLIAQCSYMVDILCLLTKSKRIPLAIATILFELKMKPHCGLADGSGVLMLRHARHLHRVANGGPDSW